MQALGPRQIRLLQLGPDSPGKVGDNQFSITTRVFDLNNAPAYKALSYTWGDPYDYSWGEDSTSVGKIKNATSKVSDTSKQHPSPRVGVNLRNALRTVRDLGTTEWLWADAISINQEDHVEKAMQVRFMETIFSSAEAVIVWLGEPADGDGFTLSLRNTLGTVCPAMFRAFDENKIEWNTIHAESYLDPDFRRAIGINDLPNQLLGIASFCQTCRWFNRVWCIQEIVLAQKVIMLFGHHEISWKSLEALTMLMNRYGWCDDLGDKLTKMPGRHAVDYDCMAGPKRLWKLSRLVTELSRPQDNDVRTLQWQTCASILAESNQAQCTDERDRVYGMLGILDLACRGQASKQIQIDYTKTPETIYRETAEQILTQSGTLDVICWKSKTSVGGDQGLPSWAINYAKDICSLTRFADDGDLVHGAFCAAKGLVHPSIDNGQRLPFRIQGSSLHCYGVDFDSIIHIADCTYPRRRNSPDAQNESFRVLGDFVALNSLQIAVRQSLSPQDHSSSVDDKNRSRCRTRYERLWRTLILDHAELSHGPVRPSPDLYEQWFLQYVIVDTVLSVHERKLNRKDTETIIEHVVDLLKDLESEKAPSTGTNTLLSMLGGAAGVGFLIRTHLITLRRLAGTPTEAEELSMTRDQYSFHKLFTEMLGQHSPESQQPSLANEKAMIYDMCTNVNLYTRQLTKVEPDSRLFVTARGLLGLGPASVEIGDKVWALKGGRVPFVLRPTLRDGQNKYRVVGGCFILDHMNGEILGDNYGLKEQGQFIEIV